MAVHKLRKVVLFSSLTILCIYFAVMFFVNLNEISQRELEQATFQITEYLTIVDEFAEDMSKLSGSYLDVEDARIDKYIDSLEYKDNYTYGSSDEIMDLNRRIIGRGTEETVERDSYYINLAYVFDRFFRDFSVGFPEIVSMNYFSEHDFVYTYSNLGADYLSKVGYYVEKSRYEEVVAELDGRRDVMWQYTNDENYSDKRELIANIPIYEDDRLEGVVGIRYALDLVDNILANNYYQTYLIDKDGTIVSSNVNKTYKRVGFSNVKDSSIFGEKKGEKIIECAFENNEYELGYRADHFRFSNLIEDQYVLFVYVPAYTYLFGIIYSLISMFVICKIALWLEETYDRLNIVRTQLKQKYSEVSRLKVELEHVSKVDFLTNLYNRRYFLELLEDERFLNSNNTSANFILILIDIDHFKNVNDTYGHAAGDEVLKTISSTIVNNVRGEDIVCRWGGEELLVVLTNIAIEEGMIVAEKLRQKVQDTVTITDTDRIDVTISAGVTDIDMTGNFDNALTDADSALYEAKSTGRNKIVLFDGTQ